VEDTEDENIYGSGGIQTGAVDGGATYVTRKVELRESGQSYEWNSIDHF
jgi:hypothetical protein